MRKLSKSKKIIIVAVLIFAMAAIYLSLVAANYVASLCAEEVRAQVTDIVNESNYFIKSLNVYYDDYFTIHTDKNGDIEFITSNTGLINQINIVVQTEIQNRLNNLRTLKLHFPIGAITGSAFLANYGWRVPVAVNVISNCYTRLKSEFYAKGINQTLHRLQVDCFVEMKILVPLKSVAADVTNEILIAENVIVGKVPETYLGEHVDTDYLDLIPNR